jgi:hypothetical protein
MPAMHPSLPLRPAIAGAWPQFFLIDNHARWHKPRPGHARDAWVRQKRHFSGAVALLRMTSSRPVGSIAAKTIQETKHVRSSQRG